MKWFVYIRCDSLAHEQISRVFFILLCRAMQVCSYVTWVPYVWHDSWRSDATRLYGTWLYFNKESPATHHHTHYHTRKVLPHTVTRYRTLPSYVTWVHYVWHDSCACDEIRVYVTLLLYWGIFCYTQPHTATQEVFHHTRPRTTIHCRDMWHESFMWDMTHADLMRLVCMWHDYFTEESPAPHHHTHYHTKYLVPHTATHYHALPPYVTGVPYVWHVSYACDASRARAHVTWLSDLTHLHVWHDSFTTSLCDMSPVTWPSHYFSMWHDMTHSLLYEVLMICDMTHARAMRLVYMWHDYFTTHGHALPRVHVTCRSHVSCKVDFTMWHDCFTTPIKKTTSCDMTTLQRNFPWLWHSALLERVQAGQTAKSRKFPHFANEGVMNTSYERVMSHIWRRHVTHMNESCHTYEWVMSHIWMSHVTHMNASFHTHEQDSGAVNVTGKSWNELGVGFVWSRHYDWI